MGVPLAGVSANIKIGANAVAWMNTWTVTAKANVKETTAFQSASGYATKTATVKEWSVKIDGPLDATDTNGQVALINGLGNTFALEMDTDAAGTHKWTGSAILTAVEAHGSSTGWRWRRCVDGCYAVHQYHERDGYRLRRPHHLYREYPQVLGLAATHRGAELTQR